jgi:hypothetical protein
MSAKGQKRTWRDLLRAAANKRQGTALSAGELRAEPQKQMMPPVAATEAIRCSQSAVAESSPLSAGASVGRASAPFSVFSPVAFHAVVTDFRRCGGPRLRHPDWFVAIRTMLPVRRHSWPWHVGDSKADNTHSVVVDVLGHCVPNQLHGRTARAFFCIDASAVRSESIEIHPVATTETRFSYARRHDYRRNNDW